MVEVWNWTGFYIGGNAGYSWGRSNTDVTYFNTRHRRADRARQPGSITDAGFDMNGAIAGGQIGYNWQSSNWVFGRRSRRSVVGREAAVRPISAPRRPLPRRLSSRPDVPAAPA